MECLTPKYVENFVHNGLHEIETLNAKDFKKMATSAVETSREITKQNACKDYEVSLNCKGSVEKKLKFPKPIFFRKGNIMSKLKDNYKTAFRRSILKSSCIRNLIHQLDCENMKDEECFELFVAMPLFYYTLDSSLLYRSNRIIYYLIKHFECNVDALVREYPYTQDLISFWFAILRSVLLLKLAACPFSQSARLVDCPKHEKKHAWRAIVVKDEDSLHAKISIRTWTNIKVDSWARDLAAAYDVADFYSDDAGVKYIAIYVTEIEKNGPFVDIDIFSKYDVEKERIQFPFTKMKKKGKTIKLDFYKRDEYPLNKLKEWLKENKIDRTCIKGFKEQLDEIFDDKDDLQSVHIGFVYVGSVKPLIDYTKFF